LADTVKEIAVRFTLLLCVTPASHVEGTVRQLVPKWQQVEHACFTHLFNL